MFADYKPLLCRSETDSGKLTQLKSSNKHFVQINSLCPKLL